MKPPIRVLRIGLACTFFLLGQPHTGWARDDFQVWETVELKKRLGAQWELFFRPEARIRDDASELFYHEYRQGVRWKPCKHLQVGVNYLFARNESSGKPREEHTGELDVTPKASLAGLDLSVRGRLAMRTIERSSGEQEWQLRMMPKVAYPTQFAGHKVTPYIADDWFYDYTRDAWNQNRFYAGFALPLGKVEGADIGIDLYYMLQHQLGAQDWSSNHILGTQLTVQF